MFIVGPRSSQCCKLATQERVIGAEGHVTQSIYKGQRFRILTGAAFFILLVALIDWRLVNDIPLGFLYLIPMLMLGRILNRWQIITLAIVLTFLTESFDSFHWSIRQGLPRDVLYFTAFLAIGIFAHETVKNRRLVMAQMAEIEEQRDARKEAEEQLRILIESSPAAVVMSDSAGSMLMANDAAHRLLGLDPGMLQGRQLDRYFPGLSKISHSRLSPHPFRTVMQSHGMREDGESFMADICFSTYATGSGARLAAMILDSSEELRTREESSLHQMLAGSRIAVAAISHEVRNVCAAISVVHQNLSRASSLVGNKDFDALGSLVLALERIAAVELGQYPDTNTEVDLLSVLDDLKIIIAPSLEENSIQSHWDFDHHVPVIWGDRTKLLQVFLNLTTNSIRALRQIDRERRLSITVRFSPGVVSIDFTDNGGGVERPEDLFHPFQPGARATGLGLYLSRAFARSFGGDLRYTSQADEACFTVELPRYAIQEDAP
jgi:two-component system, LuxR family, sensor kinase FixL